MIKETVYLNSGTDKPLSKEDISNIAKDVAVKLNKVKEKILKFKGLQEMSPEATRCLNDFKGNLLNLSEKSIELSEELKKDICKKGIINKKYA